MPFPSLPVKPALDLHEVVVRAALDHRAVPHGEDPVGVAHRRQSVRHHDRRLAPRTGGGCGNGVVQRGLYALLALGVERGGGLVQ